MQRCKVTQQVKNHHEMHTSQQKIKLGNSSLSWKGDPQVVLTQPIQERELNESQGQ